MMKRMEERCHDQEIFFLSLKETVVDE